jgi:hypothetical protein
MPTNKPPLKASDASGLETEVLPTDQFLGLRLPVQAPAKGNVRFTAQAFADFLKTQVGGGLSADYTSTESIGGISAGDTFTTSDPAMVQLLVKDDPKVNIFAIDGKGSQVVEVGTPFGAGFKSVIWDISFPNNVKANSLVLRDVTAGNDMATNEENDGTLSASTVSYVAALGETRRYRLSGTSTKGKDFSADIVHAGAYLLFYGPASATPTDRASALALSTNQLAPSGGTLVLNTGTTALKMVILLPPGRTLQNVTDLTNQQLDLTAKYVAQPTISIPDASGTPVPGYTPYVLSIATPYTVSARHSATYA